MNKKTRNLSQKNRRGFRGGQAMLEFAMTAVVFFTMVFGIIEFGYAFYCYDLCSYAAKNGTRYAIVHGSNSGSPAQASDVKSYVLTQIAGLDPNNVTVNTTWSPDNSPGSAVTVQVQYNFHFVEGFVPHAAQMSGLTFGAHSQGIISQ